MKCLMEELIAYCSLFLFLHPAIVKLNHVKMTVMTMICGMVLIGLSERHT